ncbi:4'-phosphopantetheinyl transferase superfamily protein [Pedobacter sp. P351]|uniref:4'-phosphopantetheinyl transferase family protein n=1 Tax=Pedobacter superstes TaxID=3133441 RepID=UPI0030B5AA3C
MELFHAYPFNSYFSTSFVDTDVLTKPELSLTRGWAKKRSLAFSTGRFCARKALLSVGVNGPDILIGPGKEPLWPDDIVGSISHSDNLAGAIVARSDKVKSLGLDIETLGKVQEDIWGLVFTPREQTFLKRFDSEQIDLYSTLIFSVKECFYKLQFPLTKTYLDFKDVEISLAESGIKLTFVSQDSSLEQMFLNLTIEYLLYEKEVITCAYLIEE